MFNTPKKLKQPNSNATMEASQEINPHVMSQSTAAAAAQGNTPNKAISTQNLSHCSSAAAAPLSTSLVFENGTMFGSISNDSKLTGTSSSSCASYQTIPEIVISSSCSTHSLNRSRCENVTTTMMANSEETAVESTSLLDSIHSANAEDYQQHHHHHHHHHHQHQHQHHENSNELQQQLEEPHMLVDEFEQFILNRTTSESNILESSIYSELQFPPSIHGGGGGGIGGSSSIMSMSVHGAGYVSSSGGTITIAPQVAGPQTPSSAAAAAANAAGQNMRQAKRTKRKHKTKSKCTATAATLAAAAAGQRSSPNHHFPPRYTAIFMDPHGHGQYGNVMSSHHNGNAANALGQIASAAASSPFLNGPVAAGDSAAAAAAYMQQFQYFQQRPMVTAMGSLGGGHRRHHRSLFEAATTTSTAIGIDNPLNGLTTPISPASVPPSGLTGTPMRLSFRKWFSRPSLPFVIGILALGGVACTLGGIVLGSTGLIEHSTQYLSAALLMIGIGVSLLVISGAIWRLSLPDDIDECPCYRHMEMCRNCNSPYCNSRLMGGSYLYPEFQHRPPPPSYLTSLNECAGMSLLFHPTASAQQAAHYSTIRVNTPPPLYRSTNSLSVNGNTSIVPSLPAAGHHQHQHHHHHHGSSVGIVPDHTAITMSSVMENLQAQTQAVTKEFNYYELD